MKWIEIKEQILPRDGIEYLTRNELQGGTLQLVYWDKIHNCYRNKGQMRLGANIGSQWLNIPKYIKEK